MESQQRMEIGSRIRELRESSTETNRSIADYCSVGERTVAAWVAGDGISYKNAKKVAELFEVNVDWLWRGRERGGTPDLMNDLSSDSERLAALEEKVDRVVEILERQLLLRAEAEAEETEAPPSQQSESEGGGGGRPPPTG